MIGLDQLIVDPLVISLPVMMRGVLTSRLPKRPFSKEDHPVEALILDGPDEPLGMGVQIRRPGGKSTILVPEFFKRR